MSTYAGIWSFSSIFNYVVYLNSSSRTNLICKIRWKQQQLSLGHLLQLKEGGGRCDGNHHEKWQKPVTTLNLSQGIWMDQQIHRTTLERSVRMKTKGAKIDKKKSSKNHIHNGAPSLRVFFLHIAVYVYVVRVKRIRRISIAVPEMREREVKILSEWIHIQNYTECVLE